MVEEIRLSSYQSSAIITEPIHLMVEDQKRFIARNSYSTLERPRHIVSEQRENDHVHGNCRRTLEFIRMSSNRKSKLSKSLRS